ncbi:hypothetical protein VPH35_006991 [Triticum aestivum]
MSELPDLPADLAAGSDKRSYVIKVDDYSRIKLMIGPGNCVKSAPFSVGGYDWVLRFYPNGCDITQYEAGCVSVLLALDSGFATDVRAKFKITLLDKDGVPAHTRSKITRERIFSSKGSCKGFSDFVGRAYLENPSRLSNDSVSIMCHVTVVKNIHRGDRLILVPSRNLHQHLGDLLKSMDGADVTFHVGGESFSAHRVLFGGTKEKAGGPIEISDMESDVFKALLHFIYTDEEAVMAGHLLVAADRYNIEGLKVICEERMCNLINPDIVATSLALAEQHGFRSIKDACFDFLASPSNLEAMMASDGYEHLKNSCPSVLKELAASFLPAELKAAKDIIMTI